MFESKENFYEIITNLMAIFADWEKNLNQLKEILRRL